MDKTSLVNVARVWTLGAHPSDAEFAISLHFFRATAALQADRQRCVDDTSQGVSDERRARVDLLIQNLAPQTISWLRLSECAWVCAQSSIAAEWVTHSLRTSPRLTAQQRGHRCLSFCAHTIATRFATHAQQVVQTLAKLNRRKAHGEDLLPALATAVFHAIMLEAPLTFHRPMARRRVLCPPESEVQKTSCATTSAPLCWPPSQVTPTEASTEKHSFSSSKPSPEPPSAQHYLTNAATLGRTC